jgi:hypothetical protein
MDRRGPRAHPMRPKARGLAQHGGPPGWLQKSDPAGVILHVMEGPPVNLFLYQYLAEIPLPRNGIWLLYSLYTTEVLHTEF